MSGLCDWCSSTAGSTRRNGQIFSIAEKMGIGKETLRKWVRRAEIDDGLRSGVRSADAQWIKELEPEAGSCHGQ